MNFLVRFMLWLRVRLLVLTLKWRINIAIKRYGFRRVLDSIRENLIEMGWSRNGDVFTKDGMVLMIVESEDQSDRVDVKGYRSA